MFEIAIILLLLFVVCSICGIFAVTGFFVGLKVKLFYRPKKPPDEDKETEIKKKQARRALDNFYSYTGDEQK